MHSQSCPFPCVQKVGTPSICCKEMLGSDGHAGVACWPCLEEKSMSVYRASDSRFPSAATFSPPTLLAYDGGQL